MANKNRKHRSLTIADFAWQRKPSINAHLHDSKDDWEKMIKEADLNRVSLTDEDIKSASIEPMNQADARKLLYEILFHGTNTVTTEH